MGSTRCRSLAVVPLLVLSACHFGPTPSDMPAAVTPMGASVQVTYRQAGAEVTGSGESIEVRDDGLLVRLPGGFTLLHFPAVVEARFDALESPMRVERPAGPEALTELAHVSRYPFGLDAERLARLLSSANQAELIEVGR